MSLNDAESSTQGEAGVRWSGGGGKILLGSRQQGQEPPSPAWQRKPAGAAGLVSWLGQLLTADLLIKESNVACCRFFLKVIPAE